MDTKVDKKNVFITVVTALLVSIGVTLGGNGEPITDIFVDELADYFCCIVNDEMIGEPMEFKGGISKTTGYSGYPFNGSRKGATYCKSNDIKGKWIQVGTYADSLEIDKYDLMLKDKSIEPKPSQLPHNADKEDCRTDGKCYPI